jgi:CTP:phosphocholine cytidylyltransferase-like protein
MINRKEFEVLMAILEENNTQRALADRTGYSVGTVNKTIKELTEKGLLNDKKLTEKATNELEPYRVKRAIFLAAGFGSRLVPITLNTPKPLVRVNGKRIIESLLDAVVKAEIPEIIIVRGYLGEQFEQLVKLYPQIKFIDNKIYNESNNISSAIAVKDLFENAYVLESDLLLKNPKLIRKYEYQTNFLGIPVEVTDDWCFYTDCSGIITKQAVGGQKCHQMVGVSYWDKADGQKLSKDLQEIFDSPGGKERYWEQTALEYKKENYKVLVRECKMDDIVEIDTFNELKQIDKSYDV